MPTYGYPGTSAAGDFSVYVGDLDPNVTDSILLDAFSQRYKSIINANVIVDPITKRSKKYGFVRFSNFEEQQKAIVEMNGKYILSRPIKLNVGFKKTSATPTQPSYAGSAYGAPAAYGAPSYGVGGYGASSYPPAYGQSAPPSYPPSSYSSYGSDPYAPKDPGYSSYGGGYNYSAPPAYGQPSQYPSYGGGYSYPPASTSSGSYGMTVGGQEYPSTSYGGEKYSYQEPKTSYSYGQSATGYSSYDTSAYPTSGAAGSYGAPATSVDPNSAYQYDYSQSSYNYPAQPVVAHVEPPVPVQPVKEIDIDFNEASLKPLFDLETTSKLNQEYFDSLMSSQGTVSIM